MNDEEDFAPSQCAKPKSDQLNADDLIGGPITITIRRVTRGSEEQTLWVYYEGDDGKPWKPCKGMQRVMIEIWGDSAKAWRGKSVTLFRDPTVKLGKDVPGGIRISHISHIDSPKSVLITVARGRRKLFTVQPLRDEPIKEQKKGDINQARVALEGADSATAETLLKGFRECSWTREEKLELQKLGDEAKARPAPSKQKKEQTND